MMKRVSHINSSLKSHVNFPSLSSNFRYSVKMFFPSYGKNVTGEYEFDAMVSTYREHEHLSR